MNALVEEFIKQLALEGSKGCLLSRLWTLLENELPISGLDQLEEAAKHVIWDSVTQHRCEDYTTYISEAGAQSIGLIEADEEAEVDGGDGKVRFPFHHEKSRDVKFLEDSAATLIAVEACRFRVLGVCDAQTSRFKLSDKQLEVLEVIGKARRTGCLQSDLARTVGVEHKNFFFIIKQLEGRELAVRNPVILSKGEADSAQHGSTNIIHLPMFAPDIKLRQFQAFKMVEASENEDEEEDMDSGIYKMRDDASWMRQICEKISDAIDKTVLEYEVKQSLGFYRTKGHRLWRRLKKKMVDLGLLETFIASVHGKPSVCVKLIHEDFDGWLKKQRDIDKEHLLEGPECCILAEKTLNQQLLQRIIDAGPQGISSKELFSELRLNAKKNSYRLKQLQSIYGIQLHTETRGKSCVNRCFAPIASLKKPSSGEDSQMPSRPTIAPPAPGSWMDAVHRAVIVGCNLMKELGLEPQHEDVLRDEHPVPLMKESLGDESDDALPVLPSYPDPTDEAQKRMRDYLFSNLVSSRSDFQYKQLLKKVREDGFVIRGNIATFLKDQEMAHGVLKTDGKGPDRKTVDRVISRLIQDQKVKKIKIAMLSKTGGEPKQVEVIIQNDLIITENILQKIRQANRFLASTCRQRSHIKVLSQLQEAKGKAIPIINNISRLAASGRKPHEAMSMISKAESSHYIHRNGYIQAKLIRAKLLHNLICRLVGLAGFEVPKKEEESRAKDHGFPRFIDPKFIEKAEMRPLLLDTEDTPKLYRFAKKHRLMRDESNFSHLDDMFPLKTLARKHSFTPRELWDFMPTDLFLQIVGSNQKCEDILSKSGLNLRMGEIPVEEQVLLVDKGSRNRLSDLLDVLCRMGLLEGTVAALARESGITDCAKFIARETGTLEKPEISTDFAGSITQVSKQFVKFQFCSVEDLEDYWMQLEFVFSAQRHLSVSCFPATIVPEVCSSSSWSASKLMSMAKWMELTQVMNREEPVDWKKCKEIANRLNINYQQVLSFAYERRRKQKIKKSAYESLKQEEPSSIPTNDLKRSKANTTPDPKRRKKRQKRLEPPSSVTTELKNLQIQEPLLGSDDEMEEGYYSEEPRLPHRTSIYWSKEEDICLLNAYAVWRTTAKPTKIRGIAWKALMGLPGGPSAANIERCKRRLRHMQKYEVLVELFSSLDVVTGLIYEQRRSRVDNSSITRDVGSSLVEEYCCTPSKASVSSNRSDRMMIDQDEGTNQPKTPLSWHLSRAQLAEKNLVDSVLEVCDPRDADLLHQLKTIVYQIAGKAPRVIKKEPDHSKAPAQGVSAPRILEQHIDWSSSVVSIEKKRKTLGFRVGKERLLVDLHQEISLPVSFAKDFIISCMVTSQSNKFLTENMGRELVSRFKDEEMLQALSILHQQGWINPGGTNYPINLSPAFKNKLSRTGLSKHFFAQAHAARTELDLGADREQNSAISSSSRWRKTYRESDISPGALAALLSALVVDEMDFCACRSTPDGQSELQMDFKVAVRTIRDHPKSSTHKKEGLRATFSELLRESEMEIEELGNDDQPIERHHMGPEAEAIEAAVAKAGENGISHEELKKNVELGDVENSLQKLCAHGDVRCFESSQGKMYLTKGDSDRFIFAKCEGSKMVEVPIRPWRDHKGVVNREFMEKLQVSILNTVIEHPGIHEELLIEQIGYCNPHNTKEIILLMEKQGLITKKGVKTEKQGSYIPSIFRKHGVKHEVEVNVYFVNLKNCFGIKLPVLDSLS